MKLTKAEKKWIEAVNKLLAACPSERLGFFTIGDPVIHIYDATHHDEIMEDGGDLVLIVQRNGWLADEQLNFPNSVEGVCG